MPLIGGGQTRFQPVFVGDVAAAIAKAVDGDGGAGTVYELGGPEVITFTATAGDAFSRRSIARACSCRCRSASPICRAGFSSVLPKPPLTADQVAMLKIDNVVAESAEREGRTLDGLGIDPTTIEAIVPSYLWRFRKAGQFEQGLGLSRGRPSAEGVERGEAERADDDAPPAEHGEAVARDIVEQMAHHEDRDDEGGDEAEADLHRVGGREQLQLFRRS